MQQHLKYTLDWREKIIIFCGYPTTKNNDAFNARTKI